MGEADCVVSWWDGAVAVLHRAQLMSAGAQADSLGRLAALIAVMMGDFQW